MTRLDLAHLAVGIGNAALEELARWPKTGEGRDVKAKSETISRLLEFTHDKVDIVAQFEHLENIIGIFHDISRNEFFDSYIKKKKYTSRSGDKSNFGDAISGCIKNFSTFSEINKPKRKKASQVSSPDGIAGENVEIDPEIIKGLDRITPTQKLAPLQFEFVDGYIQIRSQIAQTTTPADQPSASSAREALGHDSANLIKLLKETNCDPRLIEAVEELGSVISSNVDIIKLGFLSFTCDSLFVRFSHELSDIASAKFLALSTGLNLYVSQFSEWRKFVENAAETNIHDNDVQNVYSIGVNLMPTLEAAKDLVDPEVPKSIKLVLEALKNPKLSAKRAFFGAVRTLENLLATIFSEFAKLASSVSDGARAGAKHTVHILVASTLLLIAAGTATQLSPIAERALKARWMKQAAELVEKAIK